MKILGLALVGLAIPFSVSTASLRDSSAPLHSVTLAVKFVEFKDSGGRVPLTREQAAQVVSEINREYAQCGMALRLEQYQQVEPSARNLPGGLSSMDQLDPVRSAFDDPRYLVVVNTGAWDHDQMGSANAWTAMPGQRPAGAVIEGPVAGDSPVVAHELGHYLGLDHISQQSDMMNPIIYSSSTAITPEQCRTMQDNARGSRLSALR